MATEIEILGHKAKIGGVSGQVKDGLLWMEDKLVVWLSFDEAVGSVLSFPIYLPVKQYKREEFLYNVRRRGEEDLKRILEMDEQKNKEREEREQRKAELDAVAAEAQRLIE